MKQHNTTPYDEMMAFLINATCPILSDDHEWLCALHDTHENFQTIFYGDVQYLIELAIRYGFFDSVSICQQTPLEEFLSDKTPDQLEKMHAFVTSILENEERSQ